MARFPKQFSPITQVFFIPALATIEVAKQTKPETMLLLGYSFLSFIIFTLIAIFTPIIFLNIFPLALFFGLGGAAMAVVTAATAIGVACAVVETVALALFSGLVLLAECFLNCLPSRKESNIEVQVKVLDVESTTHIATKNELLSTGAPISYLMSLHDQKTAANENNPEIVQETAANQINQDVDQETNNNQPKRKPSIGE